MAKAATVTYSRGRLIGSGILTAVDVGLAWAIVYYFALLPFSGEWSEFTHYMGSLGWNLGIAIFNPVAWGLFLAVAFDILIIIIAIYGSYWSLDTSRPSLGMRVSGLG